MPARARSRRAIRNLSREDLESVFADYLGIKKTLWLNRGIAGDDTHGHVDDLARFVGARTVVAVEETNPDDENYRTAAGKPGTACTT